MNIATKYHGVREFDEGDLIFFSKGIPGFPDLKKYIVFQIEDNEVFNILHSVEDESVGFVVVSPFIVMDDYEIKLPESLINDLKVQKPEEVMLFNIVTLNSDVRKMTVNMCAPVVININSKLGEQLILEGNKYEVKHPLFKE